jgi:hypothetical protein
MQNIVIFNSIGLGVELNSSTYSMSEALMALPNLTISNGQMFKQVS